MAFLRDPAHVLCAHCVKVRAEVTCAACSQEICDPCASDLDSCPAARAFEIRLGLGARLRLLSASAELGVVSTLSRRLFLVQPTRRRILARGGWSYRWRPSWTTLGGISRRGELLRHGRARHRRGPRPTTTRELVLVDSRIELASPARRSFFDRSERAVVSVSSDETLDIGWLAAAAERDRAPIQRHQQVEPFPHAAIQTADFDAATGLLAAGTFGRLVALRVAEDGATSLGAVGTGPGDILWCGVAAGRVAAVWEVASGQPFNPWHRLGIYQLGADGMLEREAVYTALHRGGTSFQEPVVADISDDGRFVAAALHNRDIAIHDAGAGEVIRAGGHTDAIATLRFGPGANWLVSGDLDNRIIVRHRGPEGFARHLEPAELRRERD